MGSTSRDVNPARCIHRRLVRVGVNDLVSILENRAIQLPVLPVVLREWFSDQFHESAVTIVGVQEMLDILWFEQVEAEAEADHGTDHRDRLVRPPDLVGGRVLFLFELIPAQLSPSFGLLRRVLPKVDTVPQPVKVAAAPAEPLNPVDDPEGRGQIRPMIPDHRPMIIVKSGQRRHLASRSTCPRL